MNSRRGSALLIVLGFLSFMVVSAVAFSIYMRAERVPSSVFRRSVQSRQLVKAALARAMSEIDDAVRADPYPGLTTGTSRQLKNAVDDIPSGMNCRYADVWYGRVFMPPNPDIKQNGRYDGSLMASADDTVSVVTLEGLGYLPPALINDVRFLARGSWTSKWRMLNYGAGRFAYCAVNVSDYLDVTRILADEPRTSANRINLSPLFADKFDSAEAGVSDAKTFASFLASRGGTQSTWPFVSMLDYALGMRTGQAGLHSPFYRWCKGGRTTMYDAGGSDDAIDQPFVTDSWLPAAPPDRKYVSSTVDLNDRKETDEGGQPFPQRAWMTGGKSYEDISSANSYFARRVADGKTPDGKSGQTKSMMPVTYALLYDYLDRDDMPVSLALPCVERVPMVTAISPNANVQMRLTGFAGGPTVAGNTTTVETQYKVNPATVLPSPAVQVAYAFPFKRGQDINRSFKMRVLMRVFLIASGAKGVRTTSALAKLRPSKDLNDSLWNSSSAFTLPDFGSTPPIVFTYVSDAKTITPPSGIKGQDDAVQEVIVSMKPISDDQKTVMTKRETTTTPTGPGGLPGTSSTATDWKMDALPFAASGNLLSWPSSYTAQAQFLSTLSATKLTVQAAVWVAIEDSTGDVVDFVPALAADDKLYNNVNNGSFMGEQYDGSSEGTPLFRFTSDTETSAGSSPENLFTFDGAIDKPQAYFAVDPRYNWAPEDWVEANKQATGNNWLDFVIGENDLLGKEGRDSDIFMFVSNQGFLQSMGELAFLPRVTEFPNQTRKSASNPTDLIARKGAYDGVARSDWKNIPNVDCVWRTYRPYAVNDAESEYLMEFSNFIGSQASAAFLDVGDKGCRVNPYTDNEKILMTAFAYTPYDWWAAAGTNTPNWQASNTKDSHGAREGRFKELSKSRDYTFNGSSSEAKISDEKIRKIARAIRDEIRANPGQDWKDVYDGLNWYGSVNPDSENSFKNFLGVNVDEPLHGVDRKFLYAFWRGCLANRQQLFLVFLRAESMALGGSGEGQIPPQQGGHAVALVWRDPENPLNLSGTTINQTGETSVENWVPHQMRVLFFHQFD